MFTTLAFVFLFASGGGSIHVPLKRPVATEHLSLHLVRRAGWDSVHRVVCKSWQADDGRRGMEQVSAGE